MELDTKNTQSSSGQSSSAYEHSHKVSAEASNIAEASDAKKAESANREDEAPPLSNKAKGAAEVGSSVCDGDNTVRCAICDVQDVVGATCTAIRRSEARQLNAGATMPIAAGHPVSRRRPLLHIHANHPVHHRRIRDYRAKDYSHFTRF